MARFTATIAFTGSPSVTLVRRRHITHPGYQHTYIFLELRYRLLYLTGFSLCWRWCCLPTILAWRWRCLPTILDRIHLATIFIVFRRHCHLAAAPVLSKCRLTACVGIDAPHSWLLLLSQVSPYTRGDPPYCHGDPGRSVKWPAGLNRILAIQQMLLWP